MGIWNVGTLDLLSFQCIKRLIMNFDVLNFENDDLETWHLGNLNIENLKFEKKLNLFEKWKPILKLNMFGNLTFTN